MEKTHDIVARFSLSHMRYIASMPAKFVKSTREKYRVSHLCLVCFQYDGGNFHSDIRLGKWHEIRSIR